MTYLIGSNWTETCFAVGLIFAAAGICLFPFTLFTRFSHSLFVEYLLSGLLQRPLDDRAFVSRGDVTVVCVA